MEWSFDGRAVRTPAGEKPAQFGGEVRQAVLEGGLAEARDASEIHRHQLRPPSFDVRPAGVLATRIESQDEQDEAIVAAAQTPANLLKNGLLCGFCD